MKKLVTLLFFLTIACFGVVNVHAAYLRDIPVTVTQPDGTVLHCFASGDEFFNYLHDSNGYTIIQHPQTGYYVYADIRDGHLVPTEFVANRQDPASKGLRPYALISPQEWMDRRRAWEVPEAPAKNRDNTNHGTLNNISIFIRFADDGEFTNTYSSIDNMFNDVSEGAVSMRSYFRAASYGAIEIPTTFYPGHNGETIISYQDIYPRSYFQPYNETTNPNGYQGYESLFRESALLERAVNYVNTNYPVPSSLNIDYDNNGYVDNVCFIVKGSVGNWNSLLWPHKGSLEDKYVYINGKRVYTYNFQLADDTNNFNTSVMCHEMNHSLGAPDLYHYSFSGPFPVGIWDLMDNTATPPQHCGAYMKMKYGHWIDEIPEITQAGTYTLNPISSATPTNVAYKIQTDDPNQFYVLEYRDNTSLFETGLPGSGLLVYRIDTRFSGNASYDPSNGIYDEVYIYRPGGSTSANGNLNNAYFSSNVGRTEFSSSTSAYPFFSDGTPDYNFRIYNITNAGNTISFMYGTSLDCAPPTNLIASLDGNNVSLSWSASINAMSYNIYRNGSLIDNTNRTTYYDNNLAYGTYTYFLKSVDASGLLSTASEIVNLTIIPEGFVIIGDGELATNDYFPSYSYYKYTLSQQIYTSDEIGSGGAIHSIAFYNTGATKTRNYNVYMVSTEKTAFESTSDWIAVTESDLVYSGEVTMTADAWTVFQFDTPFQYNGISNIALIVDDNTGNWTNSPNMSCHVFNANGNQAICVYEDSPNFDPYNPSGYIGTLFSLKNQIKLEIIPSFHFIAAGNWSKPSNWQDNALPGINNEVFIDAPCQLDMNATVSKLTILDGQSLTLQSGKKLVVTDTLTNSAATGLIIEDGAQLMHSSENVSATVKKTIVSYGMDNGKYYLISNPLASIINPDQTINFTIGNFDLYDWLPSVPDDLEWRNYKDNAFMMSPEGYGYLYANQNGVELNFSGILKPSHYRFGKAVSYDSSDIEHPGWNLIGNPYMCDSYLVNGNNEHLPYYRINAAGNGLETVTLGDPIAPMEGIFYQASESGTVYFKTDNIPQPQVPTGAINGKFTINANGDQVYFSQGNLQYIGSASTPYWKFAENQWDYLGTTTGQNGDAENVDRDLFGWGTSGYHDPSDLYNVNYQPWSTSRESINVTYNYYGYGPSNNMPSPNLTGSSANYDWGINNAISNGGNQTGQWRTLTGGSSGEWYYVFNTRSASMVNGVDNARYAKAKIANVLGVILFPDSYTHPMGVAPPVGINETGDIGWNGNDYSSDDFQLMQDAGAVFLPAAGFRFETSVNRVGYYGYYWSASYSSSNNAFYLDFSDYFLGTRPNYYRYSGQSVRLVCPAE